MASKSDKSTAIWVAVIGASAVITAAIIAATCGKRPSDGTTAKPGPTTAISDATSSRRDGRLVGTLTDRAGNPISDLAVIIRNGPESKTDSEGKFVLNNAPTGDQWVEIQAQAGGRLTQNVSIDSGSTTTINFVYDPNTSRLGLLSIVAPVDDALLELIKDGNEWRAVVHGRCDGLSQIIGGFDVWVLIRSQHDSRFWVQHPPAVIDPTTNSWRARAQFGSIKYPPRDGEQWDIVAIAADSDSEIGRVLNTPKLSLLPSHIASNVVTVTIKISR